MSYDTVEMRNLNANEVAVWMKENIGFSVTADFFESFSSYSIEVDRDRSCPMCQDDGVIIADDLCLICGATLNKTFVVNFTFSVNVVAAAEEDAEALAEDVVSVDVGYSEHVEDNYDLAVDSVSEQWY